MSDLLERILAFENMCTAWEHVRTRGQTPGVDDWSVRRFARSWEENLRVLCDEVRANRYQPRRLRVRYIPKKAVETRTPGASNPVRAYRRLGIPTLRDRILQRAALNLLDTRIDGKFLGCSYGYRPRRSLFHAVAALLNYRERGFRWVLDADIDNCFDSLDHGVLHNLLPRYIVDPRVLRLVAQWLEVGAVDRGPRPRQARAGTEITAQPPTGPQRGVSQGMPISPLLCNIYLHELDWRVTLRARRPLVRYADDFVVLARSQAEAERSRELIARYLDELKLHLQPAKTRITSFDQGFDFLGVHFEGDRYSYTWQNKQIEVTGGKGPLWQMWDYFPHGYDS